MHGTQLYLVAGTAVASGLVGGVLCAFSSFVMAGLKRLPPDEGMAAMQSINVTAVQPGLMIPFSGTMIASVTVVVTAIANWDDTVSVWLLVGAASYVLSTFAVTAVCHVPRNDVLAATPVDAPDATSVRARYCKEWTRGNHFRAAASLVAAAAPIVQS